MQRARQRIYLWRTAYRYPNLNVNFIGAHLEKPRQSNYFRPGAGKNDRAIHIATIAALSVLALMLGLPVVVWLMEHGWQWLFWAPVIALITVFLLHRPLLVLVLWLGLKR
jgi:MFS family permease